MLGSSLCAASPLGSPPLVSFRIYSVPLLRRDKSRSETHNHILSGAPPLRPGSAGSDHEALNAPCCLPHIAMLRLHRLPLLLLCEMGTVVERLCCPVLLQLLTRMMMPPAPFLSASRHRTPCRPCALVGTARCCCCCCRRGSRGRGPCGSYPRAAHRKVHACMIPCRLERVVDTDDAKAASCTIFPIPEAFAQHVDAVRRSIGLSSRR